MARRPSGLSRVGVRIDTSEWKKADIALTGLGNALKRLARGKKEVEMPNFRKNATRKAKAMIYALAENVLLNLSMNTKIGDIDKLMAGAAEGAKKENPTAFQYFEMYKHRQTKYGLPMNVGYHAGAYTYSESRIPKFKNQITERDQMVANFKKDFMANFTLGDTFYVTALGPAYKYMNMGIIGQPEGIITPTLSSVMATYKFDMAVAYKNAR